MPYCTTCGSEVVNQTKFCGRCGATVGAAAATPAAAPSFAAPPEPLDYTIQGDNLQVARLRLKPGQEVYAAGPARCSTKSPTSRGRPA